MSVSFDELERRQAFTGLLATPVVTPHAHPGLWALVRRYRPTLAQWLRDRLGYRLVVSPAGARLYRPSLDTGVIAPSRPRPASRRILVLVLLAAAAAEDAEDLTTTQELSDRVRALADRDDVELVAYEPDRFVERQLFVQAVELLVSLGALRPAATAIEEALSWDRLDALHKAVQQLEEGAAQVADFSRRSWLPWGRIVVHRRAQELSQARTQLDNTTRARRQAEEAVLALNDRVAEVSGSQTATAAELDTRRIELDAHLNSAVYQAAATVSVNLAHLTERLSDAERQLLDRTGAVARARTRLEEASAALDAGRDAHAQAEAATGRTSEEARELSSPAGLGASAEAHLRGPAAGAAVRRPWAARRSAASPADAGNRLQRRRAEARADGAHPGGAPARRSRAGERGRRRGGGVAPAGRRHGQAVARVGGAVADGGAGRGRGRGLGPPGRRPRAAGPPWARDSPQRRDPGVPARGPRADPGQAGGTRPAQTAAGRAARRPRKGAGGDPRGWGGPPSGANLCGRAAGVPPRTTVSVRPSGGASSPGAGSTTPC